MSNERKHHTPEEKVTILRRHLLDRVPVSTLEHQLQFSIAGSNSSLRTGRRPSDRRRAPTSRLSGVAQTYAFLAFVCGSSSVDGISCLDVNIMVAVSMLRTAEEAKLRLPLMRYPAEGRARGPKKSLGEI